MGRETKANHKNHSIFLPMPQYIGRKKELKIKEQ
jgi:hypothetical protein